MRTLMRVAVAVFAIAALLGTGVLATLWFAWEPLLPFALWLASMSWFDVALLVTLCITAIGLVALIVAAIALPARHSAFALERDGGSVAISKEAIRSTATRSIESHHGLSCTGLKVAIKGNRDPRIRIRAEVDPGQHVNLTTLGQMLQSDVAASVSQLANYPVERVDVVFSRTTSATAHQPAPTTRRNVAAPASA